MGEARFAGRPCDEEVEDDVVRAKRARVRGRYRARFGVVAFDEERAFGRVNGDVGSVTRVGKVFAVGNAPGRVPIREEQAGVGGQVPVLVLFKDALCIGDNGIGPHDSEGLGFDCADEGLFGRDAVGIFIDFGQCLRAQVQGRAFATAHAEDWRVSFDHAAAVTGDHNRAIRALRGGVEQFERCNGAASREDRARAIVGHFDR